MELEVIKLYSDTCKPCIQLDKNLEGKEYKKVDVFEDHSLALQYNVRTVPTMLFFLGGELKEKKVGVFTAEEFDEIVKKVMES